MSYLQRQAIWTLNYGEAVKVAIKFKTRSWGEWYKPARRRQLYRQAEPSSGVSELWDRRHRHRGFDGNVQLVRLFPYPTLSCVSMMLS